MLGLLIMWVIFVTVVLILKTKIGPKADDSDNFKNKYDDLDEVIERKKKEIQQ